MKNLPKYLVWGIVAISLIGFVLVGIGAVSKKSCLSKNPKDTCGVIGGLQSQLHRGIYGLSAEEAAVLVQGVTEKDVVAAWWAGDFYSIGFTTDEKVETHFEPAENKIVLRIDKSWGDVENDLMFELGHVYYQKYFCPKYVDDNHRMVCYTTVVSPPEVSKRYLIQSHLFAVAFATSDGAPAVDDKFVDAICNYKETDPYVQQVIAQHGL